MERQDLRSVLRLFSEIASSMHQEESGGEPVDVDAGDEPLPDTGEESWMPSIAR